MLTVSVDSFLFEQNRLPVLDVRSPKEYAQGHIPNAHSLPLFTDEERAIIGTLYKNESPEVAVAKGEEIAFLKVESFLTQAEQHGNELKLYCWRGGMRSHRFAEFFEEHGYTCHVLKGGYKAYRQEMLRFFEQDLNLVVITGLTGSGKTEILHALKDEGEQVIDLEAAANHQGSRFGNELSNGQPSTEQYQNLLFEQAKDYDRAKRIWIEDESFMIGKCAMPKDLFEQKEQSPHVLIKSNIDTRLDLLVGDYGDLDKESLIRGMEGIRRKLGGQQCDEAIQAIEQGDLRRAAEIALVYYDKQYERSLTRKRPKDLLHLDISDKTRQEAIEDLLTCFDFDMTSETTV